MQVAILCGGLGTRLGGLTQDLPKSMVSVAGKPFLLYQIGLVRSKNVRDIVLCVGHLGRQIKGFFGAGEAWGVQIQYSDEGEALLGTGGALKKAAPLLEGSFLVMNGDTYLPVDFVDVLHSFEQSQKLAMMVIHENANRYDTSNVIVGGGLVQAYVKQGGLPGMVHIDAGVVAMRREALRLIPSGEPASLNDLYQVLIQEGQLAAYETKQRFYEIGSLQGLEEFRRLVARGDFQLC